MIIPAPTMIDLAYRIDGVYHPTYSGRGMMSRTCPAITHDHANPIYIGYLICQVIILHEYEDTVMMAEWLCENAKTDNMGHGWVMYWPDLEAVLVPEPKRRDMAPLRPRPTTVEDLTNTEY